jgi:uncharacterized membrane protein HdeD (DUF308 family)
MSAGESPRAVPPRRDLFDDATLEKIRLTPEEDGREIKAMARARQDAGFSPGGALGMIVAAPLLVGCGYVLHGYFERLEALGLTSRPEYWPGLLMPLVYGIGGKSAVFGYCVVVGALLMMMGVHQCHQLADKKRPKAGRPPV